jgi:hypothetical protein
MVSIIVWNWRNATLLAGADFASADLISLNAYDGGD